MKKKFYLFTGFFAVITPIFFILYKILGVQWLFSVFLTALTFFYHLSARLAVGFVIDRLPIKYNYNSAYFRQKPFEAKLYKLLNVKRLKSNAPTWNPESFSAEKNSLEQIMINMCQSETVHTVNVPISFLSLLFCLLCDNPLGNIWIFLITAIAAAIFDLNFVIIQRYNRERLIKIIERKNYRKNGCL